MTVSIEAWRHTTTPFPASSSSIPGWTATPPPQATTSRSSAWPFSTNHRSRARKAGSPSSANISATDFPALRSISWSLSAHLKPIRWATARPTVVLPVPMKPTRYRLTSAGFRVEASYELRRRTPLLWRSRSRGGRWGIDVQEVDLENERGARRNPGAAFVAVAEVRRDVEPDLPALARLLQPLGPACDDLVEPDVHRFAALQGTVEHGAVQERARVVHAHGVRRLGRGAPPGLEDLIAKSVRKLHHVRVRLELREVRGRLAQVPLLHGLEQRRLPLLDESVHGRPHLLDLVGGLLGVDRRKHALRDRLGLARREPPLRESGPLPDIPAELLQKLALREGRGGSRGRCGCRRGGLGGGGLGILGCGGRHRDQ